MWRSAALYCGWSLDFNTQRSLHTEEEDTEFFPGNRSEVWGHSAESPRVRICCCVCVSAARERLVRARVSRTELWEFLALETRKVQICPCLPQKEWPRAGPEPGSPDCEGLSYQAWVLRDSRSAVLVFSLIVIPYNQTLPFLPNSPKVTHCMQSERNGYKCTTLQRGPKLLKVCKLDTKYLLYTKGSTCTVPLRLAPPRSDNKGQGV